MNITVEPDCPSRDVKVERLSPSKFVVTIGTVQMTLNVWQAAALCNGLHAKLA